MTSHLDREQAVLTLAAGGRMARLDEDGLAALCELADDEGLTLAELLRLGKVCSR